MIYLLIPVGRWGIAVGYPADKKAV